MSTGGSFMGERRRHARIPRGLKIVWRNEDVTFDGVTLDICPGGLFIITNHLLPARSMIHMEMKLENESIFRCSGKVVWLNRGEVMHYPQGFGVEFLGVSAGDPTCLLSEGMESGPDLEMF